MTKMVWHACGMKDLYQVAEPVLNKNRAGEDEPQARLDPLYAKWAGHQPRAGELVADDFIA